jgi:uncharacterized protein YggT (Ycf19 family)
VSIVDFILNLAALLLWIGWRASQFDPLNKRTPATLMGTLRPAAPKNFQRWHFLILIAALIFLRAIFYWQVGSALKPIWVAHLNLMVTDLSFFSNWFGIILLFSFLSFARALGIFYLWLLLLSILSGPQPIHRLVRMQLGRADNWPVKIKIFLPFIFLGLIWFAASRAFARLQLIPASISFIHQLEQSVIIALASYLVWKFLIAALLILHLLNSYIYFGKNPFWNYINAAAQNLLSPLKKIPLQIGRVDFAPVLVIAIIFFLAEFLEQMLVRLYARI